ncbi:MAG: hypothetical protein ACXVMS_08140 [Flavisolibacter sp.]
MTSIQTKRLANTFLAMAAALSVLFYFSSCAKKINFQGSSVVPAARGEVKVKKDHNNNYRIQVSLNNLAEPGRLQPPKKTYVVWMETGDNLTKNIGQINSSTGFLSGKLKASFETVSSTKPTKIFLTSEDDPNVQYPGSQVVLSTNNF